MFTNMLLVINKASLLKRFALFYCIYDKNKPPAMQVCSRIALASSKKNSNDIMSAGSPTAQIKPRRYPYGQKQFSTHKMGM